MTMSSRPLEVSNDRKRPITGTKSFPGRYASLAKIGEFVRKFSESVGFESFALYSIEMAVDEACSNIIEHAYGGEGKGSIRCSCSVNDQSLTIVLQDSGQTFNPSDIPKPNLSDDIDQREAHGLGLYFIRQWMDEVYFETNGQQNTLTMVKRKGTETRSGLTDT
jgi:serine/threonine-protein kinase RsbW